MSVAAARGFLLHPQNALKAFFIRRSLCSSRPFFKTLFTRLSRPQNQFKFNDQQKQSQKPSRNVKENASLWHHQRRFEQPFKFRIGSRSTIVEQMHFCSDIVECKLRARLGKIKIQSQIWIKFQSFTLSDCLHQPRLSLFALPKLKPLNHRHVKAFNLNWIEAGLAATSEHGWQKWNAADV